MKKRTKVAGCIFFISFLLIVPNIQAIEFRVIKDNIEEQIEKNFFNSAVVNIIDIWDLIEFLHSLLVILINFILMLSQKFIRLLFSPLLLVYYLIWWILMVIFPH
jgi:hypothetical protein